MTSKLSILFVVILLSIALMAPAVNARHKWDKLDSKVEKVKSYDLLHKKQAYSEDYTLMPTSRGSSRASLGSSGYEAANSSPGFVVDKTWDDWPYQYGVRMVDFRGNNDIHFVYHNLTSSGDFRRYGYNVYDPTGESGAAWPNIAEVGCEVQSTGDEGLFPNLAVQPSGLVVITGWDAASGEPDNHTFYQSGQHSCFWGGGTQIPPSLYRYSPPLCDATSTWISPRIEVQDIGGTIWTHVVGGESGFDPSLYYGGGDGGGAVIMYARKSGTGATGVWQDFAIIDTVHSGRWFGTAWAGISASRISQKVAIAWTKPLDGSSVLTDQQYYDQNVWYRESATGGAVSSWGNRTNITNYPRDVASFSAWMEHVVMYDSDDNLHIIWNGCPTLDDAYTNPNQTWNSDWSSVIFHWRYLAPDPTDSATSRVNNAIWPNLGGQNHCAFHGNGTMNTGHMSIGECAGRLYVVWAQSNDGGVDPPLEDDCEINPAGVWGGNGEIYMCVSSTLEGNAWDQYRNITHTITPDCDTATGSLVCQDDTKPSLSTYGMDRQTGILNWNESPDPQYWFWNPLSWASPDSIEGTWTNDSILQLFYLNDHMPGAARQDQGAWTENDYRWIQLACVEAVVAPSISANPSDTGFPYWTANGKADTLEIEVRNDGNAELDVVEIDYAVTSGDPDWLGVSVTQLMDIPFGTAVYFDVYVNKDGIIDNPGGSEMYVGEVWLKPAVTDPPANTDSLPIHIEVVVCDTMAEMHWDTVATTEPWGDGKGENEFVALVVDNMGSGGFNGQGGVNLDYTVEGNDCVTDAEVYLYSGGLLLLQNDGDSVYLNTSLHATGFGDEEFFKPLADNGFTDGSNADYDSAYSGTFVNWDSSLIFTRTFYAPRNHDVNPTFVVVKSTMDGADDGSPITNLTIGAADDWDIPTDDEDGDNSVGVMVAHNLVYCQGIDTAETEDPTDCQENAARFGGHAFLGYHTATEYTANSCANNETMYGSWADSFHGWWDDAVDSVYAEVWDSTEAKPGLNGNTGEWDQAVFITWLQDYTLPAGEELTFYSVYVTVQNGDLTGFEASVTDAKAWFYEYIRPGCGGCCIDDRGDVDLEGACSPEEQDTDISDLTNMIDHLFINYTPVCCVEEGDVSPWIKGDPPDGAIDIGDLTDMIDHLFINYPPMPSCQYP